MGVFVIRLKTLLALALVAVLTALACVGIVKYKQYVSASKNGYVIVIDPGHGGADGGVLSGTKKVKESEINLYVSKILANLLSRRGYTVKLTRSADVGLYEVGASNKKLSDMQKRKQIINDNKPDLVISIHQNHFSSASVRGAHVFYSDKQEESERYAQIFQADLNASLGQNKSHKKADYYVLQCSPYPSLLIECGFLSNPIDESNLLKPSYREKIAEIIASSVDKLFFAQTEAQVDCTKTSNRVELSRLY